MKGLPVGHGNKANRVQAEIDYNSGEVRRYLRVLQFAKNKKSFAGFLRMAKKHAIITWRCALVKEKGGLQ